MTSFRPSKPSAAAPTPFTRTPTSAGTHSRSGETVRRPTLARSMTRRRRKSGARPNHADRQFKPRYLKLSGCGTAAPVWLREPGPPHLAAGGVSLITAVRLLGEVREWHRFPPDLETQRLCRHATRRPRGWVRDS